MDYRAADQDMEIQDLRDSKSVQLDSKVGEALIADVSTCYAEDAEAQGAGNKRSLLAMQDLKYRHKFDMLVILEPRISSGRARKLLWNDAKFNLRVIHCMDQTVSVCVETSRGTSWIFTATYGHPCPTIRSHLWQNLSIIAAYWNLPWVVCGDFNDILFENENFGKLSGKSRGFKDWFDQHRLIDLGFLGPKFTWVNKRVSGDFVMKRLDRAICNKKLRVLFREPFVRHLPRRCFDHGPLLISLISDKIPSYELKPFGFEAMRLKHCLFSDFIKAEWKNLEGSISNELDMLIPLLWKWNTQVFGQIFQKKKRILARLQGIQRRRRNRIERLKYNNGDWISSKEGLKALVVEYFHGIFLDGVVDIINSPLPSLFAHIPEADLAAVNKDVIEKEAHDALFAIGPYKAPGPDGYSAIFFHNCWSLCKKDIEGSVFKCFSNGFVVEFLNNTIITLVPKITNPHSMLQFRPISLCNTLYKVVSKIIVGRLIPLSVNVLDLSSLAQGRWLK
ncbi:unnamed protein product [Prunus armeniaca]